MREVTYINKRRAEPTTQRFWNTFLPSTAALSHFYFLSQTWFMDTIEHMFIDLLLFCILSFFKI